MACVLAETSGNYKHLINGLMPTLVVVFEAKIRIETFHGLLLQRFWCQKMLYGAILLSDDYTSNHLNADD
jgi:hypothetical protein